MHIRRHNYYTNLTKIYNAIDINKYLPKYVGSIYHYTGPQAFCSILKNKKLRFTNKKYLNDTTEGIYVLNLCANFADKICKDYPEFTSDFRTQCQKRIKEYTIDPIETYQCSFSIDPDSLCLWNYYTHGDSILGYNLEIDPHALHSDLNKKYKDKKVFYAGRVLYGEEEQVEALRDIANPFFEYYNKFNKQFESEISPMITSRHTIYFLLSKFILIGDFFKPKCFIPENEYRMVFTSTITEGFDHLFTEDAENDYLNGNANKESKKKNPFDIDFFTRKGLVIPYIDIEIPANALKSIRLSPTLETERAKDGAFVLSQKNFGKQINSREKILTSEIPLRY